MYAFLQKEDIKAGRDFNRHKFNRPKIKPSLTGSAINVIVAIPSLPLMLPHLWLRMFAGVRSATLQKQQCPAKCGAAIDLRRGREMYQLSNMLVIKFLSAWTG